jgi:hypothetical protein
MAVRSQLAVGSLTVVTYMHRADRDRSFHPCNSCVWAAVKAETGRLNLTFLCKGFPRPLDVFDLERMPAVEEAKV